MFLEGKIPSQKVVGSLGVSNVTEYFWTINNMFEILRSDMFLALEVGAFQ